MNLSDDNGNRGPGSDRVPEQTTGAEMNAVEKVTLDTAGAASSFYEVVRARLLDVNRWGEMAKLPMSAFKLFDDAGRAAERPAAQGDFIRIDIPGPGIRTGEGYDWVLIEELAEDREADSEVTTLRVRPSAHPLGAGENTAHFLKDTATSTFQVKRMANEVTAEEHGRNEVANLETGDIIDNIRNAFVGFGAKLGFSYPQWKSLVAGLLDTGNK
ncbi:hypothetical protein C7T94_09230 [Pedobacter yulinensis]|uniref:Uncharacterized protein n=1 Tax=Pedobacter yulinensis TaxID=2126353 RepID=A0A2T3HK31_9SPHI|nr:hypothetical protein [Pedobacter yulinensis]PST82815.1 hypothetical protein C7T94_09230 [Pedobacter yulinensis]